MGKPPFAQTREGSGGVEDPQKKKENEEYVLDISQFFLTNPNNCAKKTNSFGMCHKELGEVVL
jgi:hypothetical protein